MLRASHRRKLASRPLLFGLLASLGVAGLALVPVAARAQTQPTTGNSGCYPDPRIELLVPSELLRYQRNQEFPDIDFSDDNPATEPAGRLVDIQWLMGCALCECGDAINLVARISIPPRTTPTSGNTGQLHSLVIGSDACIQQSLTAELRRTSCVDIGGGPKPFSYWVNAGAPLEIPFNPSLIVYPGAPDSCDPTQPSPSANTVMLIPDYGSTSVGSPYLRWQTCDSSGSSSGGTTSSINAIPVQLFAPLQPTSVTVDPGKNALNVTWDQNLTDSSVYQYQALCMPVDGKGPAFANPPAPPAFLTGPGLCGSRARAICDGFSAGGGPSVVVPITDGGAPADMTPDSQLGGNTLGTAAEPEGSLSQGGLGTRGTDAGIGDATLVDGGADGGDLADVGNADLADVPADLTGDAVFMVSPLLDPKYVCSVPVIAPQNTLRIEGLENGREYMVAIVGINRFGNASSPTNAVLGTPMNSVDFYQKYRNDGGKSQGGYCFVATAAYGSYDHAMVKTLRAFRDQVLLDSPGGPSLVSAYYAVSPPLARFIEGSELRRGLARGLLWPAVLLAAGWLAATPALKLLIVLAALLGLLALRERRRHPHLARSRPQPRPSC